MIPEEVAAIADLIHEGWRERTEDIQSEVLAAAWRLYRAAYVRYGPTGICNQD